MIESNINKDLERKIDLYINGHLTQEQVDELWAELIQDEYYLDYTKTMANLKNIIEVKKGSSSKKHSNLRKIARYASAAAVVLFVGILGITNYNITQNEQFLALSEIPLDTYRNAEGSVETIEAADSKIQEAIQLANSGNVNEAITMLNQELEITDSSNRLAQIGLSLGAIQYNNADYLNSIGSFELVVSQADLTILTLEKGYFYLGNAYFQIDKTEKAKEAFQKAFDLNGQYRRVARSYLDVITLTE